jgi:hypothetical protein
MTALYTRRSALHLIGAATASISFAPLSRATDSDSARSAATLPMVTVNKDPTCSCCTGWADHLRAEGFPVTEVAASDLKAVRTRLGVPTELAGCHTAEVGGYVIEGHVPAGAIKGLLGERPAATGLAVPGMPAGSPGMGGEPEIYEVTLFRPGGRTSFGRYQGANLLP